MIRAVPGEGLGLNRSQMRPNAYADALERIIEEQRAIIDCLKAMWSAGDPVLALVEPQAWMLKLCRQERALVAALMAVSPKVMSAWDLMERIPGRDHVDDRQPQIIKVLRSRVHKKLERDGVIQSLRGDGYFMPTAERDRLLAAP